MSDYFLYLSSTEDNKIKHFYLADKKNELFYMGNSKISDYVDNLKKINVFIESDYFLIIPIDYEKIKIFFCLRYCYF